MSKQSITQFVYDNTNGITKAQAKQAVDSVFDAIKESLANGDDVAIKDFGAFKLTERGERTARNPKTGEPITVAACKVVKFKAGKTLKTALNG